LQHLCLLFDNDEEQTLSPTKIMTFISVKKGFDLKLAGMPADDIQVLATPDSLGVLPEKIPFVKPRLKVEVGSRVHVGTVLFEDKRNPAVKFLSPGGGKIDKINFGPRRIIQEIIIALDQEERYLPFEKVEKNLLDVISREALVQRIMAGGLWPLMRELPFRDYPAPHTVPPAIFVGLSNLEPFQPAPGVYLKHKLDLFEFGLAILKKLTAGSVFSFSSAQCTPEISQLKALITHTISGHYPADDPGVFLYHIKHSRADNRAWYISGQDLLLLSTMLSKGIYPIDRIVVLGGECHEAAKHYQTRLGVPLAHIAGENIGDGNRRCIAGGVFKGYTAAPDTYLGLYETSIALISENDQKTLFDFMRPGYKKPSFSRTFLSSLNTAKLNMDCSLHGEERACINCGYCEQVCAVDILPQFTYKSILIDEVEEALSHGLLDCVECGLCTYVCPSKIELCAAFKKAKLAYYREMY
jgi:Na+-transporting NADH:ubiquinone oxidoreductase subunit A